jgi:hypothetical protein
MTSPANKEGPTVLWSMLRGKYVKTNDGKELGEIKEISENFLLLQKGTVAKKKFWIPKYTADAYDGKALWLLVTEEELERYRYGAEPKGDQYVKDLESFRGTPSGQKAEYGTEIDRNIRVVENYKNIRELKYKSKNHLLFHKILSSILLLF